MSDVSRETEARLTKYADLLTKWNPRINLVAPSTIADLRQRHIADSMQLSDLVQKQAGLWADLGSGGGLPGIVAAIQNAGKPIDFHLAESDGRKASFLRSCIRELGLSRVKVHTSRIESLMPLKADVISARALAPLPTLMSYVERHLKPDGTAWLMKGENWQHEVEEASKTWRFSCVAHPSQTHPSAAILQIGEISHA